MQLDSVVIHFAHGFKSADELRAGGHRMARVENVIEIGDHRIGVEFLSIGEYNAMFQIECIGLAVIADGILLGEPRLDITGFWILIH